MAAIEPAGIFEPVAPPARGQARRALAVLAVAMVLGLSTWFSTLASIEDTRAALGLSDAGTRALVVAVQLGFAAGALVWAVMGLPDRFGPRSLALAGAVAAAAANLASAQLGSLWPAVGARAAVGAALALVYPPLLKAAASWFRAGRALAIGVMIGALTLGSASPHLVNALGGADRHTVAWTTSAMALAGGLLARLGTGDGPYVAPTSTFDRRAAAHVLRNGPVMLATGSYLGHMWELYAGWAMMGPFLADRFGAGSSASLLAFVVVGVGALGATAGGLAGVRWGSATAAGASMVVSGALLVALAAAVGGPAPLLIALLVLWGMAVIADSGQFTTLVARDAPPDRVGTAITLQLSLGFALTGITTWLVPLVAGEHGWSWAFIVLVPGPVLGCAAAFRHRLRYRGPAFMLAGSPAPSTRSAP